MQLKMFWLIIFLRLEMENNSIEMDIFLEILSAFSEADIRSR